MFVRRKRFNEAVKAYEFMQKQYEDALSLCRRHEKTITDMGNRIQFLHKKAYPDSRKVKFITSLPTDYFRIAGPIGPAVWREEEGQAESTAFVETEDIQMRPFRFGDKDIRIGYSRTTDCWYFNLEGR